MRHSNEEHATDVGEQGEWTKGQGSWVSVGVERGSGQPCEKFSKLKWVLGKVGVLGAEEQRKRRWDIKEPLPY